MTITGLALSFDDAQRLTMGDINAKLSGVEPEPEEATVNQHLITFSKLVRIYKPSWHGTSYIEGQAVLKEAMSKGSNTLVDLAGAVDQVLLFEGDILTRMG